MLLARPPVYGVTVKSRHTWCDFFSILIYLFCCVHMSTTYGDQGTVLKIQCSLCPPVDRLLYPLSNLFGPRILKVWNENRTVRQVCNCGTARHIPWDLRYQIKATIPGMRALIPRWIRQGNEFLLDIQEKKKMKACQNHNRNFNSVKLLSVAARN